MRLATSLPKRPVHRFKAFGDLAFDASLIQPPSRLSQKNQYNWIVRVRCDKIRPPMRPVFWRLAIATGGPTAQNVSTPVAWPQMGAVRKKKLMRSDGKGLAEKWPESGPPMLREPLHWNRRPFGDRCRHDGRSWPSSMYRAGNGRGGRGGHRAPERGSTAVIALDAKTGKTHLGAHVRVATAEISASAPARTRRRSSSAIARLHDRHEPATASRSRSAPGKILWSHDFVKEFNSPELLIRPVVKTGYGCSPIAYRDTIICSVGRTGPVGDGVPAVATARWSGRAATF
mgnify:CR=1 FL=1